ncbi:MAG: Rpn family recombination-promoting nuclease/putative transposase [Clostridium sp.]
MMLYFKNYKRTIYYVSKMINKQLNKGDNYSELNKTITINILDFDYLEEKIFHSSYRLYEDITKRLLTDVVEIRFIELRKFAKSQKDYNNKLHRWLSFLLDPKGKEIDTLKNEDNEIREAVNVLYKISGDKGVVDLAELREKAVKDEISRLQGAKAEGILEGKIEEKLAIAKNLLDVLDDETIATKTGLSVEEVINLRNS